MAEENGTKTVEQLMKELAATNEKLEYQIAENKKAYEKRDSLAAKAKQFDEQAKAAEQKRLEDAGQLKSAFEAQKAEMDAMKKQAEALSGVVTSQIATITAGLPKEVAASIGDIADPIAKLKLATSLSKHLSSQKKVPPPAGGAGTNAPTALSELSAADLQKKLSTMSAAELKALSDEN